MVAYARPLIALLRYVARHRAYAYATVFFGVAGFALSFAYPTIIGEVVDVVSGAHGAETAAARAARLNELAELGVATAIGHAAVVYGRGHFNVELGHRVVCDIRRELFAHLQTLGVRFFTKERTGSILSRVLHDVHEATALIYTGIIVAGLDVLQLAIALVLLATISKKLLFACFLLFPFYGIVFKTMNGRVRRASDRMHASFSQIAGNVSEQLSGQVLVKTFTAEDREAARFDGEVARHHDLVMAQSHQGHIVAAGGEVLVNLGTTIVIGYGGWLALRGELTPGEVTRFLGYMLVMFGPVRRFSELNMTYQTSLSAMKRVFRVFAIRPSIVESASPRRAPPSRGHVVFDNVRFRYSEDSDETRVRLDEAELPPPRRAEWVLDGVSLEARPGERIAIVGPSGAGKTTLVSLVPRLFDVCGGRIVVDGTDVRDYSLHALRSAIAVVQQDTFLFTGTIRQNVAYGRPDATDEAIVAAAKAAHAHEFIASLPDGYDTQLGERGINLSGGQRQRMSIARALLREPRILVLDEATSSLDTESEAIVQAALEALMRTRTCLVVAHRLSTIRNADRIVVLEHGRVTEIGTHDELLVRSGAYARLVRHQRDRASA